MKRKNEINYPKGWPVHEDSGAKYLRALVDWMNHQEEWNHDGKTPAQISQDFNREYESER